MMVDLETGTWTTFHGFVRGWSPDGKWLPHRCRRGRPGWLFLVPADLIGTISDLDDIPNFRVFARWWSPAAS